MVRKSASGNPSAKYVPSIHTAPCTPESTADDQRSSLSSWLLALGSWLDSRLTYLSMGNVFDQRSSGQIRGQGFLFFAFSLFLLHSRQHDFCVLFRLHAIDDGCYLAFRIHQESCAIDAQVLLAVHAFLFQYFVFFGDRLVFIG